MARRVRHRTKAGWDEIGVAVSPQVEWAAERAGGIENMIHDPKNAAYLLVDGATGYNIPGGHFDNTEWATRNATKSVIRSFVWGVAKRAGVHLPGVRTLLREASHVKIGGRPLVRLKGGK